MEPLSSENPSVSHWEVDGRKATLMNVASLLLMPVGLFLFIGLARAIRPEYTFTFQVDPHSIVRAVLTVAGLCLSPLLLSIVIILFHEWCHGLAYQWAGAKPQYGAKIVKRIMPVLYATAPGKWLTKRQYLVNCMAPTVLVNLVGIALMWPPTILRYLMVIPLVANFSGCVGDWWMVAVILKMPADTMFEDAQEGFRYRSAPVD